MTEAGVLVCDAQELMRAGLRMVVDGQSDLTVVGEAGDGETAVAHALTLRPDLVLMDVRLPRLDGISATAQLRAALPDTRVLVLTACDRDEYAYAALRAGANGFLIKDTPAAELLFAVRGVLRGRHGDRPLGDPTADRPVRHGRRRSPHRQTPRRALRPGA